MLDSPDTVFSEAINIRSPLTQPGGAVDVSAAGETAITNVDPNRFGYILFLKLTCTTASTTVGDISLLDGPGGTVLQKFTQPEAAASPGKEWCFPFPHPWKTNAKNKAFVLSLSVNTLGTWRVNVNGFFSAT
jgi:hypothetical protein